MIDPVISDTTKQQLDRIVASPPHALLLLGPDGAGKKTLASVLLSDLLDVSQNKLLKYPYIMWVDPDGVLSIDTIREVQKFVQLKTTGKRSLRRAVCLEHADSMTAEAQNALLKILEEPPADTVIVLTAQHKRALLPTILSRVQVIQVLSPTQEQLETHFAQQKTVVEVRKAYLLSNGLPGLMQSILADDQGHPLLQQIVVAKELLQKPTFERLALVDSISKQKEVLGTLLDALERIAQSGLKQGGKTTNLKQIVQWHTIQKEVSAAKDALAKNANAKLVLTSMFLNF